MEFEWKKGRHQAVLQKDGSWAEEGLPRSFGSRVGHFSAAEVRDGKTRNRVGERLGTGDSLTPREEPREN